MTIDEKKKWLDRYLHHKSEIEILWERCFELMGTGRKMAESDNAKIQAAAAKLEKATDKLVFKAEELENVCDKILMAIDSIADERLKEIVYRRHIEGKSIAEISEIIYIEKRWLYRLYDRALTQLEIPEEG